MVKLVGSINHLAQYLANNKIQIHTGLVNSPYSNTFQPPMKTTLTLKKMCIRCNVP